MHAYKVQARPDGSALQTEQSHKLSKAGYKQSLKSCPAVSVNIRTKRYLEDFSQVYYISISATATSISAGEGSSVLCISTYIDIFIMIISFNFHKNTDSLICIYPHSSQFITVVAGEGAGNLIDIPEYKRSSADGLLQLQGCLQPSDD